MYQHSWTNGLSFMRSASLLSRTTYQSSVVVWIQRRGPCFWMSFCCMEDRKKVLAIGTACSNLPASECGTTFLILRFQVFANRKYTRVGDCLGAVTAHFESISDSEIPNPIVTFKLSAYKLPKPTLESPTAMASKPFSNTMTSRSRHGSGPADMPLQLLRSAAER